MTFTSRPRAARVAGLATTGFALLTTLALAACSSSTSPGGGGATDQASQAASTSRTVNVTVTAAKGCVADHTELSAGALTFKIKNLDATAVSEVEVLGGERIVGEKENLPPGFGGEFSINIPAGSYQLYCPGATPERSTLKVTGSSSGTTDSTVAALLKQATVGYAKYVDTQVGALVVGVAKFNRALHGSDLKAAQTAYMQARPFYERIEPVAESFVVGKDVIDTDIDVRLDKTTSFASWRGFHRIEYGLFKEKSLKGMGAFGDKLVSDVNRLQKLTNKTTYPASELANGAVGLLDEVAANKITGEEERYSLIDLLDFANNDEGAEQAFAQLQPALLKIDPTLTKQIETDFAALDKLVGSYRTDSNASGYELYSALNATDTRQLSAAVKAVSEPLSTIASKVANA